MSIRRLHISFTVSSIQHRFDLISLLYLWEHYEFNTDFKANLNLLIKNYWFVTSNFALPLRTWEVSIICTVNYQPPGGFTLCEYNCTFRSSSRKWCGKLTSGPNGVLSFFINDYSRIFAELIYWSCQLLPRNILFNGNQILFRPYQGCQIWHFW